MLKSVKIDRHQLLLALPFLVLLINNYELTFLVWLVTAAITLRTRYSVEFLRLITLSGLILIFAMLSTIGKSPEWFKAFRDIAYLLKPILGMMIGYNLYLLMGRRIWRTLIHIGVFLAVYHILTLLVSYFVIGIRNIHVLRQFGGYFDDFQIYVLVMLVFRKKLNIDIGRRQAMQFLIIIGVSSFLYLSRVNMIQFAVLCVGMMGYLRLTPRSIKALSIILLLIGAFYAAVYYSNPSRSGKGLEAFFYKIKIAPTEAFKSKIRKDDWKDFNDNYRSFENIISVRQLAADDAILSGFGLGSTIDLGREIWTNDQEFIRYIPILHNSYYTIWMKAGLFGMVIMFVFIYYLYKPKKIISDEVRYYNYLLMGSAIYLIFSNWVFMGLYLKLDAKALILGVLLCHRFVLSRQPKPNE